MADATHEGLAPGYDFDPDWEVTPADLSELLKGDERFDLVDCRGADEREITKIEPSRLVPLQQFADRFDDEFRELKETRTIVYCRSGKHSLEFARLLRAHGVKDASSLAGGINQWNKTFGDGTQY